MQEPPKTVVQFFERQLRNLSPDFRIVWGEKPYGVCRWVVERHLPTDIHQQALRAFEYECPGEDRFIDQQTTNDNGDIAGIRHIDLVSEWVHVHTVEDNRYDLDSPLGYRMPDGRDIQALWNYLHEFKDMAEQMRAVREEHRLADAKNEQERNGALARDIVSSRSLWELPEHLDLGKVGAMKGTEL